MPHDHDGDGVRDHGPEDCPHPPTQVVHPWRAMLRTVVAGGIAFIPVGTALFQALGLDSVPWIASFIALGATITRLLTLPDVEKFLNRYVPWLSAEVYRGKHRKEDRRAELQ